jgi:hypothetical protein
MLESLRRSARAIRWAALFAAILPLESRAAVPNPLNAVGTPVLDARVRYLLAHRDRTSLAGAARVPVSVRFATPPDAATLAAAERAGARFHAAPAAPVASKSRPALGATLPSGQRVLGGRTVFPAEVAPADLEALAALPGVERIETSWSPQPPQPPLYRTRALAGAESAWTLHDALARPLLGTGVLIADLDSGVDLYHPDHWRDDGPVRAWFDLDASGTLTNGDAADLDGSGTPGPGETLRWLDAPGSAPGQTGTMNPAIDHVYVDANGNGARDWGTAFGEAQPTYGEQVLRPRDLDGSGVITVGEPLVELRTCKVRAIYESDGTVRRAGVDLIHNEGDLYGHGSNVASILAGGEPGRRFGGIAPGAELLMANLAYGPDPPFVTPFDVRMAWAAAEGADILLYEDGEWIWLFLDGSSHVETLIGDYAAAGIVQVTAAGNLATGQMHWDGPVGPAPGDSAVAELAVAAGSGVTRGWGQLYWVPRPGETLVVQVQAPTGQRLTLGGAGGTQSLPQYDVWSATDVSPRGTVRVDYGLSLSAGSSAVDLSGTWRFVVRRLGIAASPLTVHAMAWDELSGWSGYSNWVGATTRSTVTWPGTADSGIVVAAYEPGAGALNGFSGRGPRVDGRAILDLAAPGSTTYTARRRQGATGGVPGGYSSFGGTSAALPHVAGSLALLRQWLPAATHAELRALLRASAKTDAQTGAVPNDDWGWGKLDVYGAAVAGVADAPAAPIGTGRGPALAAASPNPMAGATELRYALPVSGEVTVEVLDLAGRLVARLAQGRQVAGAHVARWDGRADSGGRAGPGVYLLRVALDGHTAARKVAVLK